MDFAFLILFHLTSPHPRFPLSPPTPFVTWPTTSSIICLLTSNHTSNYLPLPIFLMIIQISFIHLHRLWNRRHPWLSFLHWMAHSFFLLMPFHMAYPSPPLPQKRRGISHLCRCICITSCSHFQWECLASYMSFSWCHSPDVIYDMRIRTMRIRRTMRVVHKLTNRMTWAWNWTMLFFFFYHHHLMQLRWCCSTKIGIHRFRQFRVFSQGDRGSHRGRRRSIGIPSPHSISCAHMKYLIR